MDKTVSGSLLCSIRINIPDYNLSPAALLGQDLIQRKDFLILHQELLTSRLRMSGAFPPLPLYAFMAWTGTTLPFAFTFEQTAQKSRDLYDQSTAYNNADHDPKV
jgi:hypothetical protein